MTGWPLVQSCSDGCSAGDSETTTARQKTKSYRRQHVHWPTTKVLRYDEVPDEFRESYITDGYRPTGLSLRDCLSSVVEWHNETVNVWTHTAVTLLYFLAVWYLQATGSVDFLNDSYALPLLASIGGEAVCTFISSVAHLCDCMSEEIRHVCFYFDYAGVTMIGLTTSIGYYYYSRPEGFPFYDNPLQYLTIGVVTCTVGCYLACASRHHWRNERYLVRLVAFGLPYVASLIPLFLRMAYAERWEPALSLHLLHIALVTGGSVVNASKIPERWMPGRFNYVAHSHSLMHVLCGIGTFVQIYALVVDMKTRRSILLGGNDLSVSEVFGPIRMLLVAQALIIGYFCYKLVKSHERKIEGRRTKLSGNKFS